MEAGPVSCQARLSPLDEGNHISATDASGFTFALKEEAVSAVPFSPRLIPKPARRRSLPTLRELPLPDSAFEFQGGSDCSVTDDPMFEVTGDSLIVSANDKLQRYRFQDRKWEPMPVPMNGAVRMKEVNGRLYVAATDRLLEIEPSPQTVQIIVSLRRRPATSPVDDLESIRSVCCGPSNDVAVIADRRLFTFTPANRSWAEIPLSFPISTFCVNHSVSEGVVLLRDMKGTGGEGLWAVWDGTTKPELLLSQYYHPPKRQEAPRPRWEWPPAEMVYSAGIRADGKALWALIPREQSGRHPEAPPPSSYQDDRNATLIRFEEEFRQGLSLPLRFEKEGQPIDVFSPFQWPSYGGEPPVLFYLVIPKGLVVASSGLAGHWFIPKAALEPRLEALRRQLRADNVVPKKEGASPMQSSDRNASGTARTSTIDAARAGTQSTPHQP